MGTGLLHVDTARVQSDGSDRVRDRRTRTALLLARSRRQGRRRCMRAPARIVSAISAAMMVRPKPGMAGISVPGRLYNMMAAGKPILAAAEADSVAAVVDPTPCRAPIRFVSPSARKPQRKFACVNRPESPHRTIREMHRNIRHTVPL